MRHLQYFSEDRKGPQELSLSPLMMNRPAVHTANPFSSLSQAKGGNPAAKAADAAGESQAAKKKSKKKKKKANDENAGCVHANGASSKTELPIENGHSDTAKTNESYAEADSLPLPQRLELAASHADVHAALVGLVGWSRLCVKTETIFAFFQSSALKMVLENILRSCPTTDVIYDNLNALLANCLYVERDGRASTSSRDVATTVVTALRSIVDKLKGHPSQDVISVTKVAEYLSKLVLHYRLSLNGVQVGSELSQEILRIDAELASKARKDSAIQGQTIRDSFQRRDIRSDALTLYEARLKKIDQLVQDNISSSTQPVREPSESGSDCNGFTAFVSDDGDDLQALDPKEMDKIKARVSAANARKDAELAPIQVQSKENKAKLQTLKEKREALEAQLRALNSEISDVVSSHDVLEERMQTVEAKFEAELSKFDSEHQSIIQRFQIKERRDQIEAEVASLEANMSKVMLVHSEVQSLKEKRAVCMRQHFEGIVRYFASELPCVKFMMARVEQSEAQLKTCVEEAEGYKTLGVDAVAKELIEKSNAIQSHLEEDTKTLDALRKRDLELLDTIDRTFKNPDHVDALELIDSLLRQEVHRHIDYVHKLYERAPSSHKAASKAANESQQKK